MALIPDVAAALEQTVFGAGGKSFSDPNRVPMQFTSLRRLRLAGLDLTSRLSGGGSQDINSPGLAQVNENVQSQLAVIEMSVNPNSISFRQPKRITKRDTLEGSVFFHFTNSKGENNDILTMEFRGNTGNLDLRGDLNTDTGVFSTIGGTNTGANKKLAIWQNLWQLTRGPILLDDNTLNEFMINYNSIGIPVPIALIGHYNAVLEFTESADKPFSRDYSLQFTVQEITPSLDDLVEIIQSFAFDPATTQTT